MLHRETALEIRNKVIEMERVLRAYSLAGGGNLRTQGSLQAFDAVTNYIYDKLKEESKEAKT